MRFYEVFLGLSAHGRPLGRACVQTIAESPFKAAVAAEGEIERMYKH